MTSTLSSIQLTEVKMSFNTKRCVLSSGIQTSGVDLESVVFFKNMDSFVLTLVLTLQANISPATGAFIGLRASSGLHAKTVLSASLFTSSQRNCEGYLCPSRPQSVVIERVISAPDTQSLF